MYRQDRGNAGAVERAGAAQQRADEDAIYTYIYTHTQYTDMIGAMQVRSSVLVQLNSERMKTRHARDAALSEMSHLINSVLAAAIYGCCYI